jgi:hypothetical protein
MPKLSVAIERFAAKPEVEFIETKEREFARSMASCSPSLSTAGRFTYEKRRGRESNPRFAHFSTSWKLSPIASNRLNMSRLAF